MMFNYNNVLQLIVLCVCGLCADSSLSRLRPQCTWGQLANRAWSLTARGYLVRDDAGWFFTCAFVQSQYYGVHSDLIKGSFEGSAVF